LYGWGQMRRLSRELQPIGSAVKLTLKHLDLSENAFRDEREGFVGINNGWPAIISNLKSLLEPGQAMPAIMLGGSVLKVPRLTAIEDWKGKLHAIEREASLLMQGREEGETARVGNPAEVRRQFP